MSSIMLHLLQLYVTISDCSTEIWIFSVMSVSCILFLHVIIFLKIDLFNNSNLFNKIPGSELSSQDPDFFSFLSDPSLDSKRI